MNNDIKIFTIVRNGDESGVSGLGRILDGVVWPDGTVGVRWRGHMKGRKRQYVSSTHYDYGFEDFLRIHVDSHPTNNTEIYWLKNGKWVEDKKIFDNGMSECKSCKHKTFNKPKRK